MVCAGIFCCVVVIKVYFQKFCLVHDVFLKIFVDALYRSTCVLFFLQRFLDAPYRGVAGHSCSIF